MQPTNLTLEERERWAYAENDQRQLASLYYPGTGADKSVLAARAEAAVHLEEHRVNPKSE